MQVRPLWNQHNILEKIWFLKSTYKASSNFLESPYIIFEKMCHLQDFLIGRASAAIVYRHFNFKHENYWNAWLGMGSAIGETTSVNTFNSIDYGVIFIVFPITDINSWNNVIRIKHSSGDNLVASYSLIWYQDILSARSTIDHDTDKVSILPLSDV